MQVSSSSKEDEEKEKKIYLKESIKKNYRRERVKFIFKFD